MIADIKPYPAMKDSGAVWLRAVRENCGLNAGDDCFARWIGLFQDANNLGLTEL